MGLSNELEIEYTYPQNDFEVFPRFLKIIQRYTVEGNIYFRFFNDTNNVITDINNLSINDKQCITNWMKKLIPKVESKCGRFMDLLLNGIDRIKNKFHFKYVELQDFLAVLSRFISPCVFSVGYILHFDLSNIELTDYIGKLLTCVLLIYYLIFKKPKQGPNNYIIISKLFEFNDINVELEDFENEFYPDICFKDDQPDKVLNEYPVNKDLKKYLKYEYGFMKSNRKKENLDIESFKPYSDFRPKIKFIYSPDDKSRHRFTEDRYDIFPEEWSIVRITSNFPNVKNNSIDYPDTNILETSNGYLMVNDSDFEKIVDMTYFNSLRNQHKFQHGLTIIDIRLVNLMLAFFVFFCHYKFKIIKISEDIYIEKFKEFEKILNSNCMF